MAIVYDKLMALDIPPREQSYDAKDCILYAIGIGFGHDPMNEDELPFVYEKNLKVLPTMGTVLGHPGFWARNRDTGIDWVKVVNGEQGITLHRPIAGAGTVIGRQRIVEVIDKGAGKGALIFIGATASRRGNVRTAAFAPAKAAQRSLAESMARYLWPAGVHVAIVILDGVVDLARTRKAMPDKPDSFFVKPDEVAETVFQLTQQKRSVWSFEVEARPFGETW